MFENQILDAGILIVFVVHRWNGRSRRRQFRALTMVRAKKCGIVTHDAEQIFCRGMTLEIERDLEQSEHRSMEIRKDRDSKRIE